MRGLQHVQASRVFENPGLGWTAGPRGGSVGGREEGFLILDWDRSGWVGYLRGAPRAALEAEEPMVGGAGRSRGLYRGEGEFADPSSNMCWFWKRTVSRMLGLAMKWFGLMDVMSYSGLASDWSFGDFHLCLNVQARNAQ